jgi:acetyltransferase-like isoleucine patch superfamily enzyme
MGILIRLFKGFIRRYLKLRIAFHRYKLLKDLKGGDDLRLEGIINVIYPEKLIIGKNVYIGAGAYFNCRGGIAIGDNTIISRNVTIYSYNHNFREATQLPFDKEKILKPVTIGKYVWIGMNVTIAPGTMIGDGAVIGIGSIISGIIPENAIVGAEKPRILGYRNETLTKNLVERGDFLTKNRVDI